MSAESAEISSREAILQRIRTAASITLDCSGLRRGIDSYHVDVHLSDYFVLQAREIITTVVKRVLSGGRAVPGRSVELSNFRNAYEDMIKTSLHRVGVDLEKQHFVFLQFGVIKFILSEVRLQLQQVVEQLEETVAQLQFAGSRNLLPRQQKLLQLRKRHDEYHYKCSRAIFQQLQQEENGRLKDVRKEWLGGYFPQVMNVMFNPQLSAVNPEDNNLLLDNYSMWPEAGSGFARVNLCVEDILKKQVPELDTQALKSVDVPQSDYEVYDTFNGLFAVRQPLGPNEDQHDQVHETLSWLEEPGNIRTLFDAQEHELNLSLVKKNKGVRDRWAFRTDVKRLLKLAVDTRKKILSDAEFREVIGGFLLRGKWTSQDQELMSVAHACAYVAGNQTKKITARLDESRLAASGMIGRLDGIAKEVDKHFKTAKEERFLNLLTDLSRYRLHLKYYRFAHRVFNRIAVLTNAEELKQSRAGGHLYELLGHEESKQLAVEAPIIIHHAMINVNFRKTAEMAHKLLQKGLVPAAYFGQRYYEPIEALLSAYGAARVQITGSGMSFVIYEKSNAPNQWYAVARACGLAKEIVALVKAKNARAKQDGLPLLEIGIGIGFSNTSPFLLTEGEAPVLVSDAAVDAEKLSSCTRWLRGKFAEQRFNTAVLVPTNEEVVDNSYGDRITHYNVDGVLMSNASYKKLMAEINLKKIQLQLDQKAESLMVGKFPDMLRSERDLVVRASAVLVLRQGKLVDFNTAQRLGITSNGRGTMQGLANEGLAKQATDQPIEPAVLYEILSDSTVIKQARQMADSTD
ncbi:MAG: hypothetical protein KUG79_18890 [Pseudomonadales bacterium]|nr:hypothetical protein [Pseudomonadales bacterium]